MVKEKKYYTREELIKLDKEKEFVPLTYDGMFKGIFKKNLDLLKELILSQLELDIDRDICKIELFDSELAKDKMSEYQKTVDIYVRIDNVFVNLEINREYFKEWELEKLNELVKYTSEKNLKEDARREGLQEGLEEGREEARNELSNEHIVGMLKENIDIEVISRITGKTTEEIMVIKKKIDEDN